MKISFSQCCINYDERIRFINVAPLSSANRRAHAIAEVEELSCTEEMAQLLGGQDDKRQLFTWDRDRRKQFDESHFTLMPRECICYRRHCCWSQLHFRKREDHRRFYASTEDCWRAPLSFTLCSLPFDVRHIKHCCYYFMRKKKRKWRRKRIMLCFLETDTYSR